MGPAPIRITTKAPSSSTKTEQLTFQVPDGGPLIPYTQVTGHFPATKTLATLPPGVRQSPTTFQQNYVFRFPAKEFWRNRSFEGQHPSGGRRCR